MSTSKPAVRFAPLLSEQRRLPDSLDHDTRLRYGHVAERVAKLCQGVPGQVRILEVGCNVLNLLPIFLNPDRIHVTRCDTFSDTGNDPDYFQLDPDGPLPFEDDVFDVTVSLEVLEHIPGNRRQTFLTECLRVARRGAVWTCPNGHPAVEHAERIAAEAYFARNGREHPFLSEHHEHGLPREDEIRAHLHELDVPFAVFEQAPLSAWLPGILLGEPLSESGTDPDAWADLRELLASLPTDARSVGYRKIYVAAKAFEATTALSNETDEVWDDAGSDFGDDSRNVGVVAGKLLSAAMIRHRAQRLEWTERERHLSEQLASDRAGWEADQQAWADERASLLADWRREVEELDAQRRDALTRLEAAEHAVSAWHLRTRLVEELLKDTSRSLLSRLCAVPRLIGRMLTPLRSDERRMVIWDDVRPKMDADRRRPHISWQGQLAPIDVEWEACGPDPKLVLPGFFPAGWLRVRVRLKGTAEGQAELYADYGDGFRPETRLDSFDWIDDLDADVVYRLDRPVRGLRLDPLSGQDGSFRVEMFRAGSLPPAHAFMDALRRKFDLVTSYRCLGRTITRGMLMLMTGRWSGIINKLFRAFPDDRTMGPLQGVTRTGYDVWRKRHALTDEGRAEMRRTIASWDDPPLISVVMPVYNPEPEFLERAIESVRNQIYPHWQLCITDDASTNPEVRTMLRRLAARDPRIDVVFAEQNAGISAASNQSLERARGSYIALLDNDDAYAEHALFRMAEAARKHPLAEMIYSDEDKLDAAGRHIDPFFKPDWAPDYFLTCMYTCHLTMFRTEVARSVGGFRSEFDFAQDYDLALRVVSHVQQSSRGPDGTSGESERIIHVPDVLYHWRMAPTSTATGHEAKPQAELAAQRAVRAYLERMGRSGVVERGPSPGLQRVRYDIVGEPKVSIVIPTASRPTEVNGERTYYLARLIESVRSKSTYANYEILAVDNGDMGSELRAMLDQHDVRRVSFLDKFNLAEKMNLGAREATGEYLILLNDDMEVIAPDWIEAMLSYAQWPEIGAVGAKLFFENGNLQHAGVTFVGKYPFHHFYNQPGEHPGYWAGNILARNYSCVTGACMMVRRDLYLELGGFDPAFPLNFNDVDFCLKVIDSGRRIVFQPEAQLYHYEGVSKDGCFVEEIEKYLERHGDRWECDPMYNPNLTRTEYDYRIGS